MSYCRWGPDSDVYVYPSTVAGKPAITCCCCKLTGIADDGMGKDNFDAPDAAAMLTHLDQHIEAGDAVPHQAISWLKMEQNGVNHAQG